MSRQDDNKQHHYFLKGIALAAIPVAYVGIAKRKFKQFFKTNRAYLQRDIIDFLPDEYTVKAYEANEEQNIEWYKNSSLKNFKIKAFDGISLNGMLIENRRTHRYVIMAHDYNEDCYALLAQAHLFDDLGFNVLMLDLRGWGDSEGQYTTLGFKESLDILAWIDELKAYDPNAEIGLYGVGMGASSCLLTAQHALPVNVNFVISDCAYADGLEYLERSLNSKMYTSLIKSMINDELHFNLEECNVLEAVKKIATPTLFIHGTNDRIIPCQDTLKMYENCNAPKELLIIEDSDHGFNCYRDGFKEQIEKFVNNL